ncbi:RabGAP/TBC [Violaceomyces palustris]|uniref:RabGAP/TBC n=1 Tax=Violaceomyces palustris TaxID=1673888 RepID=A0ACD0P4W5_9BASI|nr:RabGAP/TBC [Violaceomyces palustris]
MSSKNDWEDQAWGIESDDEDFVAKVSPRTNFVRNKKVGGSVLRDGTKTARSNLNEPSSSSFSSTTTTSSSSGTSSSSTSHVAGDLEKGQIKQGKGKAKVDGSGRVGGAKGFAGKLPTTMLDSNLSEGDRRSGGRTSWTVVDENFVKNLDGGSSVGDGAHHHLPSSDRNGKRTEPSHLEGGEFKESGEEMRREESGSGGSGFQIVKMEEGQAPRTSTSTVAAAASTSGASSRPNVPRSGSADTKSGARWNGDGDGEHGEVGSGESEVDEFDLRTSRMVRRSRSVGRRKGVSGKAESQQLQLTLRHDLDEIVKDPAHALSKLSLCWASNQDVAYLSPGASSTSSGGMLEGNDVGGRISSKSREMMFDPIAAAGDGLIASSGFAESEPSLNCQDTGSANQRGGILSPPMPSPGGTVERKRSVRSSRRRHQLLSCLGKQSVDISVLRGLAWNGVPEELRPMVWQLLLGYLPAVSSVRASTLARKRAEYAAGVERAFAKGAAGLDMSIWHQIHIDVPRTNPGIRLWQREATQQSLERILYVWALRHPASGYVQGINDLATPFFEVFLSAYIESDPEMYDVALLPRQALEALEADTFWCLSKLLDGIQDNYTQAQPGIHRQVRRMEELVARIDAPLHAHLQEQGVEYMQFAFRWMNCLLMREMSVKNIVRMWDTYLAEGPDAFSDFHLYVCSVFLHKWSEKLKEMDFQGIIMFLQSLPTQGWSDKDAEMLLSEAFMYKTLFGNTAHLNK